MLTVQYCDVHVHNRCRGYRWNIVERAISRAATRPSIIGDRISSRFSEFACCKFDIAPTSFSLSLSLSLFPLFLSRVVSLLSSGGWFDALINDRVDNVGHGVPPIGYRVEWRDIQTFFSPDPCHWFWKLDDFIHFRDQNFEWRADLKFKSTRSDRDHYRNFAVCNAFLRGLTYFLASGTEDGYRRFLGIRYWTFRRFRETEGGEKATRAFGKILRNSLLRIWRKSVASFAPSICAPNTRASRL